MRQVVSSIVACGLLTAVASAADEDGRVKEELAKFQGVWQLVSAESDGKATPEEQVKKVRVIIVGRAHTVRFGDQVVVHNVTFQVDPATSPKQTTDTLNGADAGKQIRGIYKLEGDTLTSCVAKVDESRPTEFEAKAGSGHTLRIFRREKPTEADRKAAVEAELAKFAGTWRAVRTELDGKLVPPEAFEGYRMTLDGPKFVVVADGKTLRGTYEVDPLATPRTIKVLFDEGPAKGKPRLGVYELDGDSYEVCMPLPGRPIPTALVSKPGSGHMLQLHKREPR